MSMMPPSPPGPVTGDPAAALAGLQQAVADIVEADPTRVQVKELGDLLIGLQNAQHALQGVASEWTLAFAEAGGPEDAGSATLAAWFRQHLRCTGGEARRRVKAAGALRALPATRHALASGQVGAAHLDAIAHGVRLLGPDLVAAAEQVILDVARVCDADAVKATIRKLRDTVDPDAADAAYLHALDRRDVTVTRVGDGYAVGGFLDPETGTMLRQVLYTGAKPDSADDDRTAGQRRCDTLRDLCRSVLDHGLASDRGIRPHLFITVTQDRLHQITARPPGPRPPFTPTRDTGAAGDAGADVEGDHASAQPRCSTSVPAAFSTVHEPAVLDGHGPICDLVIAQLACDAVTTLVTLDQAGDSPTVLDVGRTQRLATLKQRQAVFVAQDGRCHTPGCNRTHLEIHHLIGWSVGGPTDLGNLRGYCTRCHHLIHQGHLVITPDNDHHGQWHHTTRHGTLLPDHRRRTTRHTSQWTHALLAGGINHADQQTPHWQPGQPSPPPPRQPDLC